MPSGVFLCIWWCWRVRLMTFYFVRLVSQRKSACLEDLRRSINTHQYGVFMLSSRGPLCSDSCRKPDHVDDSAPKLSNNLNLASANSCAVSLCRSSNCFSMYFSIRINADLQSSSINLVTVCGFIRLCNLCLTT